VPCSYAVSYWVLTAQQSWIRVHPYRRQSRNSWSAQFEPGRSA
jgi:hypothetical protein